MSSPAIVYAVILGVGLLCWAGGYNVGVSKGRALEQEETRTFVNERMTKAGFCKWFEQSRIAEDCAAAPLYKGGE